MNAQGLTPAPPAPAATPKKARFRRRWLIIVVLLVGLPNLFFRLQEIQGHSMWPQYNPHGDGQLVLVKRAWWSRGEVDFYESIVIVDPEDSSRTVLKRVIATAGEAPLIIDGDVSNEKRGEPRGLLKRSLAQVLAVKVPLLSLEGLSYSGSGGRRELIDTLRRPIFRVLSGRLAVDETGKNLKLDGEEGAFSTRLPQGEFRDDHMSRKGRLREGDHRIKDLIIEFGFQRRGGMTSGQRFGLSHRLREKGPAHLEFGLMRQGEYLFLEVSWDGPENRRANYQQRLELREGLEFRLVFVDAKCWIQARVKTDEGPFETLHEAPRIAPLYPEKSHLNLFVSKGSVILSRLDIARDIHYTPALDQAAGSSAEIIGPGQYFLLGDNSPESRDSRQWHGSAEYEIIGRPCWIVWPWGPVP